MPLDPLQRLWDRLRGLRPYRFALALVAVWLVHAGVNAAWLAEDMTLRSYDAAPHLEAQAHAYSIITRDGLAGLWQVLRSPGPGWWPTAGYLPWVLLALLFGQSLFILRMANLFYLAILLWATFDIGRRLRGPTAGLLAATLLSLFPIVFGEARQFGVDFPSASLTAVAMALLLRTGRLSSLPWSLAFGAVVGCGVLVRPQVALFIVPPASALLALALFGDRANTDGPSTPRWRAPAMAAASAATALLVSSVWWVGHLSAIRIIFKEHQRDAVMLSGDATSSALFYLKTLPWIISLPLVFVLLWGLFWLACRVRDGSWRRDGLLVTAAWLLGGVAVLFTVRVHFIRFVLPVCPAMALVMAASLTDLRSRGRRLALIGTVLALSLSGWCLLSWVPESARFMGLSRRPRGVTNGAPQINPVMYGVRMAADEIAKATPDGSRVRVHLVNDPDANPITLFWFAGPMLRIPLPGVELRGQHYQHYRRHKHGRDMRLGGVSLPMLNSPHRQNYALTFDRVHRPGLDRFPQFRKTRLLDLEVDHPLVDHLSLWRLDRKRPQNRKSPTQTSQR